MAVGWMVLVGVPLDLGFWSFATNIEIVALVTDDSGRIECLRGRRLLRR